MEKKWWKEEVVYQIYPKSFMDSNHDGAGDIKGIISKLDYLKDLGVTMIWVCPVYKSPMDDNGYDISDYQDINPEFGTMEDVETLIAEGKKRGIKLIMDLVINHTSNEHEWFKKAVADMNCKEHNYYIFKEGKDGKAPTNWRSVFGTSCWEPVEGQDNLYYYHSFGVKQPDLNWENPELREEIYKMICFWLEKGIAGFRVDAINFIKKNQDWPDGEVDGVDGMAACFPFCRNVEGINVFFEELRRETFDKYQCMTVAEAVGVPYDELGMFVGDTGCFTMLFDFNYTNLDINENEEVFRRQNWTVEDLKKGIFANQEAFQKYGWCAPFIENHDQPRAIDKWQNDESLRTPTFAKMLGAMYFFNLGTPFIYQGQELGMVNNHRNSIDEFDDLNAKAQYYRAIDEGFSAEESLYFINRRSRDNSRSPFVWDDSDNGGFSDTTPWIKCNEFYKDYNAKDQVNDPDSVFTWYKQMIALKLNPEYKETFAYGTFKAYKPEVENVIAYTRSDENHTMLVICNFQNKEQTLEVGNAKVMLSNGEATIKDGVITLIPFAAVVLELKNDKKLVLGLASFFLFSKPNIRIIKGV